MMAPKPPKIRPRPAKPSASEAAKQPIKKVINPQPTRSASIVMPGEAGRVLHVPPRPTEAKKGGFVARPRNDGPNQRRGFQGQRENSPRHGGGASSRGGGRTGRTMRMSDPLKSPGSMLTQRKFMPKEGSLTGH